MAYIRKFRTGSGATGVQVCWKEHGKVVRTEHIGSAETEVGLEKLLREAEKVKNAGKVAMFDLEKFDRAEERRKKRGEQGIVVKKAGKS